MREYSWNVPATSATAFLIVSKNGDVRRAAAVWVLDDGLHFAGAGADGGVLPLDSIDAQRTRRLNEEAGLTWPLAAR